MSIIAVIPARYASTRFPGKPLALIKGKPMIQHVVERCREAQCFSRVIVATDDERISAAARAFGAESVLTASNHATGTDRVAEVARIEKLDGAVVVNVQGDEPAVHPHVLRTLADAFRLAETEMATLVRPLRDDERSNPSVVKVVLDEHHHALYFSRADIPAQRDAGTAPMERWAHLGLYGYRASVLQKLAQLPPTRLEQTEALEQLRALGHGIRISCGVTRFPSVAVDVPSDIAAAERALERLS